MYTLIYCKQCDGVRPNCSRCQRAGQPCRYDVVHEGLTKSQSLKAEVARLSKQVEDLEHTLRILKHGSLDDATALLASIRLDADESSQHLSPYNESSPATLNRQDRGIDTQPSDIINTEEKRHGDLLPNPSNFWNVSSFILLPEQTTLPIISNARSTTPTPHCRQTYR